MAALGAFYLLSGTHEEYGRMFVAHGVIVGVIVASCSSSPRATARAQ